MESDGDYWVLFESHENIYLKAACVAGFLIDRLYGERLVGKRPREYDYIEEFIRTHCYRYPEYLEAAKENLSDGEIKEFYLQTLLENI